MKMKYPKSSSAGKKGKDMLNIDSSMKSKTASVPSFKKGGCAPKKMSCGGSVTPRGNGAGRGQACKIC